MRERKPRDLILPVSRIGRGYSTLPAMLVLEVNVAGNCKFAEFACGVPVLEQARRLRLKWLQGKYLPQRLVFWMSSGAFYMLPQIVAPVALPTKLATLLPT